MSNYTPSTNFAAKDALASGNPAKIIKGTEISAEFTAIQTAVATKYDSSNTIPVANGGTGATTEAGARASLSAAASGANTDITSLSSPSIGSATATTQSFGDSTTKVATTAFVDALRDVPANSQSTSYTLALTDRGKSIDFTGSTGQTITVPANGSIAFPVGSVVTITNTTANNLSIAITTDTLRQAGTANTGTRTLGQYGVATLRKVSSTVWIIGGSGLT